MYSNKKQGMVTFPFPVLTMWPCFCSISLFMDIEFWDPYLVSLLEEKEVISIIERCVYDDKIDDTEDAHCKYQEWC